MESLRLIPPVPMTIRKAAKSDWIDGIYVPKGTLFYIPVLLSSFFHRALTYISYLQDPCDKYLVRGMGPRCRGVSEHSPAVAAQGVQELRRPDLRFKPERWLHLPEAYHPSLSLQTFIAVP